VALLGFAIMAIAVPSLFAQKYEVRPYAGAFWGGASAVGNLKNEGLYGVKGGVFLDPNFEMELNAGWITYFPPKNRNVRSRGLLWEVAGDYNFSTSEFPFSHKFSPFLVGGLGGVTNFLPDVDVFPFPQTFTGTATVPNPATGAIVTVPVVATRNLELK